MQICRWCFQAHYKALQDILHNRIIQKKAEMHESHNKGYSDNLWTEIEIPHWVLAQILTIKREYTTLNSRSSRNESKKVNLSTDEIKRHLISLKE